ncbi:male-specific lethal 1-like 1 isoform X2 [Sardina pilchardus]|uniref:male-specific lethal 1-like 1 isoform X2 n=1 Tax=Sardina pilchardus TaxID=27697 RepID=UPI002E1534C8
MRSTLLTSGGLHLDTGALDLGLTKAVVQDFLAGQEEDTRHFIHTLPNLIGTFQQTSGPVLRNKNRSPARTFGCRPGQSPALGEGHVGLLGSVGPLTPPCKQMGGEGILVKSKSLFGHANKSMGKMDPVVSNGSKQPREADDVRGAVGLGELLGGLPLPSPEPCPEGKRRNVCKGPNHGAAQTNCIRQILLLQLELIEQQQQQLQSKNHEIDELKAEKEMLIARIDRMERRLQPTGKKTTPRTPQTPSTATRRKEPELPSETGEGPGLSQRGLHTARQTCFGRGGKGHKRRFLCQEPRVGRSRRGGGPRSPPQRVVVFKEEEDEGGYNENEEEEEDAERQALGLQSSPNTGEDAVSAKLMQELPYLATTDMYLCCWQPPPTSCSPWRDPSPTQEDMVDVPSWRENTVAPLEEDEATNIPETVLTVFHSHPLCPPEPGGYGVPEATH